jgi:hypothetical protein
VEAMMVATRNPEIQIMKGKSLQTAVWESGPIKLCLEGGVQPPEKPAAKKSDQIPWFAGMAVVTGSPWHRAPLHAVPHPGHLWEADLRKKD